MTTLEESLVYSPVELAFGTSGLRGLETDMTDLECYINTQGFLDFLESDINTGLDEVFIAGDLRRSTPRILKAVHKAIEDRGLKAVYCGLIPTPALSYYAWKRNTPCIMVTGSHIPGDRNGIKFCKQTGEVLKEEEGPIHKHVAQVRKRLYGMKPENAAFDSYGQLKQKVGLPPELPDAVAEYTARYTNVFGSETLAGLEVVLYQHSAVGRDNMVHLLEQLGAKVHSVGRSEEFVPIDSENVTPKHQAYFRSLAKQFPDAFAIVSTDGDGDRPFVVDENGTFHRGDVLGALVADWLDSDFAAVPVSASDAVDKYLSERGIEIIHTKIGSPPVISAMNQAQRQGFELVTGWEVNGGFLTGNDFIIGGKTLEALKTRDAFLPIAGALILATSRGLKISELFALLPARATQAGLIDNFAPESSRAIKDHFSSDTPDTRRDLSKYFTGDRGFGKIRGLNLQDGIRIFFDNEDIAHIRPSSNAPQLRIYSVADTQQRANEIVNLAIDERGGIFRQIEKDLRIKNTTS